MKKNLYRVLGILALSFLVISCGKDKPVTSEANEVLTETDGVLYKVDTMNSRIEWKGYKVLKSDQTTHFGEIKFESGDVTVKDGKLEGHLKSGDFFEVEKFPTASYEITKVTENTAGDYNTLLEGNLTIKGITKPVQFKANVTVADGNVSIASEPTDINREDFGLKFELPLENGLLNKEINLQILVKALESK